MSHYEEKLEEDVARIRASIEEVGREVEEAFKRALRAVLTCDQALAAAGILGDLPINRAIRQVDALCHAFVARHLPSAGHLRFVSSVLRLNIGVERVGDYAVTLCREVQQLGSPPPETLARDIELVGEQARGMFVESMAAFIEGNAERARGTKAMVDPIERTAVRVFDDLVTEAEKGVRPVKDLFAFLVILNRIGRVSDQAKNFCEEALFAAAGEVKEPKRYRLLFVDEHNSSFSQLAVAWMRRNYPASGSYASAGWNRAEVLDPRCEVFARNMNLPLDGFELQSLDSIQKELADFDLIIALQAGVRDRIERLPFATVFLDWDLGPGPEDLDQDRAEALLAKALEQMASRARGLMETLRGEHAG